MRSARRARPRGCARPPRLLGPRGRDRGHPRRYHRSDLENLLVAAGLVDVGIWSVAVPTANVLRRLGNFLIARSRERAKLGRDSLEQTKESGVRDIPFKTTFPPIFRLVLNRWTMWPFGV